MLIVCLAIIATILMVVVEPLVLSKISGLKITKFSMLYVLAVNGILFLVFSNIKSYGYLQEFFDPISYFVLLQIFRSRNVKINLFYTAYTISFVYFIRMFFSSLIFGKLLGNDFTSVLLGGILGYLCVLPVQSILHRCLAINPKQLIISEQEQKFPLAEKNIEKEQNRLIWFFGVLMMMLYFANNILRFTDGSLKIHYQYMLVLFVFLFFLLLYAINVKYKDWKIQGLFNYNDSLLANLAIYTKEVDESYQSTRNFRHDFANILISMRKTIETEGVEEIRQTYAEILEESNIKLEQSQKEVAKLSNIRVLELKSIISEKILKAEARGIAFELEISGIITDLFIDKVDIVRLLGIIFDNAIDAVLETQTNQPLIRVAIFDKGDVRHYIVENDMVEKELPVRKLSKEGFTTKGKHRGQGLTNLASIMKKYPRANYQISAKDYKFRVELELERG